MMDATGRQPARRRMQTHSADETRRLGRILGETVSPAGLVVALTGALGSGKTAFTQGLARGIGVDDRWYVTSPSYTLINEYPGRAVTLYHIDFYRLVDVAEAEDLGLEEMIKAAGAVVVIEWADKFNPRRWSEDMEIRFCITGESSREIDFIARDALGKSLLDDLKKNA